MSERALVVLCRDQPSFAAEVEAARSIRPVQEGFGLGGGHARELTCVGRVDSQEDAAEALLAAAHGASLVLHVPADTALEPSLLDDLSRLGPVEWRAAAISTRLGAEDRRLLELLADGHSLGEAAERLYLSRRTADRRLRAARRALGAATTAEALARFRGC